MTYEQAQAELTATAARFETEYPETNAGVGVIVDRLPEWRQRSYRCSRYGLDGKILTTEINPRKFNH